jgi:hypothetical protein
MDAGRSKDIFFCILTKSSGAKLSDRKCIYHLANFFYAAMSHSAYNPDFLRETDPNHMDVVLACHSINSCTTPKESTDCGSRSEQQGHSDSEQFWSCPRI